MWGEAIDRLASESRGGGGWGLTMINVIKPCTTLTVAYRRDTTKILATLIIVFTL